MKIVEKTEKGLHQRQLPEGWRWVKLGEVCELIMGRTPSRSIPEYWGGELPWVSITDLNDGVITYTKETISELGASASRSRLLSAGTILFSFKLTIGKMGIAGKDLYTNEAIVGVIPKESDHLKNDYLWFALKYINAGEDSSHAVKGKTLNQKTLDILLIPLPPLPEQQRIAAILREQMAAVEKARKAAQERLEAIKALPAAFLRQVFPQPGQPLPEGWRWVKLGEVCGFRRGPFGGSLRKEIFTERGYAVYEQSHAIYNDFSQFRYYIDEIKFNEMRGFQVHPGELIMSCSGTMGKVAIIPENAPVGIINQALLKLTPTDHVSSLFLKAWMESANFQQTIAALTFGAAIKNVASVSLLKALRVPLPPFPEQQRIAAMLREQMAAVEKARKAAEEELETINALPAALLRRAFSGEL